MVYEITLGKKKFGTLEDMYTDDREIFVIELKKGVKVEEHRIVFTDWSSCSDFLESVTGGDFRLNRIGG